MSGGGAPDLRAKPAADKKNNMCFTHFECILTYLNIFTFVCTAHSLSFSAAGQNGTKQFGANLDSRGGLSRLQRYSDRDSGNVVTSLAPTINLALDHPKTICALIFCGLNPATRRTSKMGTTARNIEFGNQTAKPLGAEHFV